MCKAMYTDEMIGHEGTPLIRTLSAIVDGETCLE